MKERIEFIRALRAYGWDRVGWFVPLAVALEGVGAAEAAWQPPGGGNTIWQIVNHINHYNLRLLCQMTGTPFILETSDNDATFGAPGNPADQAGWKETLALTRRNAEGLNQQFAAASDADLDLPDGETTRIQQIAAWIMHDSYHTGQIALLRKMQVWKGYNWE